MNENDKKLSDFFADLKNIEYYHCNSTGLSLFRDECKNILDKKLYSDINLQNEKGNTFLHYAVNSGDWNWVIKLLSLGSDPSIINKENRNAFQCAKNTISLGNFWRLSQVTVYNSFNRREWKVEGASFSIGYKQILFDSNLSENCYSFKSIQDIDVFLNDIGLNTIINKVRLLAVSNNIKIDKKVVWLEQNGDTAELNTEMFFHLLTPAIFTKIKQEELGLMLECNLIQNEKFNRLINLIFSTKENFIGNENLCSKAIRAIVRMDLNLDMKVPSYSGKSLTLRETIESNPTLHTAFLDETLTNNVDKKKRIKV
ncbi:ankyrin repeat domain-containing protein [archaeon]|nr:ankyrin repeat domain-containing protein [archaeon]